MRVRTRYSDPNLLPRGYDPVGTVSDKNMSRISRCPDLKNQDLGEIEGKTALVTVVTLSIHIQKLILNKSIKSNQIKKFICVARDLAIPLICI